MEVLLRRYYHWDFLEGKIWFKLWVQVVHSRVAADCIACVKMFRLVQASDPRLDTTMNPLARAIESDSQDLHWASVHPLEIFGVDRQGFHDFGVAFDGDHDGPFVDTVAAAGGCREDLTAVGEWQPG